MHPILADARKLLSALGVTPHHVIGDRFQGVKRSRMLGYQSALVMLFGLIGLEGGGWIADLGWRVPFAVYLLGVFLHFFIALSAAAVFYGASRRLTFLKEHPLVCGMFYGIAVHLVMQFIVLPLSALHARGPYQYHGFVQGLLIHMVLIGLPISFSVRRFAR